MAADDSISASVLDTTASHEGLEPSTNPTIGSFQQLMFALVGRYEGQHSIPPIRRGRIVPISRLARDEGVFEINWIPTSLFPIYDPHDAFAQDEISWCKVPVREHQGMVRLETFCRVAATKSRRKLRVPPRHQLLVRPKGPGTKFREPTATTYATTDGTRDSGGRSDRAEVMDVLLKLREYMSSFSLLEVWP